MNAHARAIHAQAAVRVGIAHPSLDGFNSQHHYAARHFRDRLDILRMGQPLILVWKAPDSMWFCAVAKARPCNVTLPQSSELRMPTGRRWTQVLAFRSLQHYPRTELLVSDLKFGSEMCRPALSINAQLVISSAATLQIEPVFLVVMFSCCCLRNSNILASHLRPSAVCRQRLLVCASCNSKYNRCYWRFLKNPGPVQAGCSSLLQHYRATPAAKSILALTLMTT